VPTQAEEQQAAEFLKRAEIKTMRKDLMALREADALVERDKIAKLKTLEEQLDERKKVLETEALARAEKAGREEILQKNSGEERLAEKDLKNYATEPERQQIFLLDSQRFELEKQIGEIDNKKDPELKLQKNQLLLKKRAQQEKLDAILGQEKKLEDEQKFIAEKQQSTTIAEERKGLEESRWDMDKKIQDVEKTRWAAEKEVEGTDNQITEIEKSSESLVTEKNMLRDKILGADKSLREIYSAVMAREEEKKRLQSQQELEGQKNLAEIRRKEKEKIQRVQWLHSAGDRSIPLKEKKLDIPVPARKISAESFEAEEEQRKQFLKDVEESANK
jgi:hypothetical protein